MRADIKQRLLDLLDENPDYLYLTPAELQKKSDIGQSVWDEFLDEPEIKRIIEKRLAKRSEIAARKALLKLEKGSFAPQEVQALQKLIDASTLLKQRSNQQEHIFVTFIPPQQLLNQEVKENG